MASIAIEISLRSRCESRRDRDDFGGNSLFKLVGNRKNLMS
jgi:hypothetical protein